MDFSQVLKQRRSIREFSPRNVENEKIIALKDALMLAPTSKSNYPCTFYIVKDRDAINRLAETKQHGSSFLKNAPLVVAIAADIAISDVWIEDAAIATTFLMLQVTNLELGGCWVQVRNRFHNDKTKAEDYVKELLHIDEHLSVLALYGIGYPATSNMQPSTPHESDVFYIG